MPNSFSALKKSRSNAFEKLSDQLEKVNKGTGGNSKDDNYWKLEVDKAGNGYAVIRFLPAPEGEEIPFVQLWDHGFQGPGGWYIENSLTTLGQDDPVSEHNSKLWNSGVDANKEIARKQKRRLSYHANIYVVKDPANPSNEGKVFKYKFGKKIFDKLDNAMHPEFEDETAFNPFDLWEGANFKLKARNGDGGYRTYEASSFDAPGVVSSAAGKEMTDDELENVWKQQYSLKEIIAPSNFKSYDELKAKLYRTLGLDNSAPMPETRADDNDTTSMPAQTRPAAKPTITDDDDDVDDFFAKLADDD